MSRILVDSRWAGGHGIGRFAGEVLSRLPGAAPVEVAGQPLSMLDPWRLARAIRRAGPDVYFSPGFNPPAGRPAPFVFTIHDLIHLSCRQEASLVKRAYYRHIVRPAARRAFRVLTVSDYSKRQIVQWARVPADHVVVVGNGVGGAFCPDGPRHQANGPYLLHVGNHKPHKNIPRLLQAFARLAGKSDLQLILTGECDYGLAGLIDRLSLTGRVTFAGQCDDNAISAYYRGARALVLPSTCEGFGLPVIEAMACGTPVIAANVASLPEVAGDAALLVDPTDPAAIASTIEQLLASGALAADLAGRGLARAANFTWDRTAARVADVLDQAGS